MEKQNDSERVLPLSNVGDGSIGPPAKGRPMKAPFRQPIDIPKPPEIPTNMGSRRPLWFLKTFTALRSPTNPYGLHHLWNQEDPAASVAWIRSEIVKGYNHGARKFFINRPMGTDGLSYVCAASWLTIEERKRNLMAAEFRELSAGSLGEPIEIVPFIGSWMRSADNINGWMPGDDDKGHLLGENTVDSQVTLNGWMSCGIKTLGIDHSAPLEKKAHFMEMHRSLARFGMGLIGEAFPRGTDNQSLDEDAIRAMPWLATESFINHSSRKWITSYDPMTTRLFIWVESSSTTVEKAREYLDRGFSLIVSEPAIFRMADDFEAARF